MQSTAAWKRPPRKLRGRQLNRGCGSDRNYYYNVNVALMLQFFS
jgi:hypothetical protein